jgi:hypothetical protein
MENHYIETSGQISKLIRMVLMMTSIKQLIFNSSRIVFNLLVMYSKAHFGILDPQFPLATIKLSIFNHIYFFCGTYKI